MNHIVCFAYVPDTETKIRVAADGVSIDEADVKWIVSPYDEYALEEALKTKEAKGGTVTAITFGPARVPRPRRRRRDPNRFRGARRGGLARRGASSRRRHPDAAARCRVDGKQGRRHGRAGARADAGRAPRSAAREPRDEARMERRRRPGPSRDRGRRGDRRDVAARCHRRHEGPERATLHVAEGDHGSQEEGDRREDACRRRRRPGHDRGPGRARALDEARAAARAAGREAHPGGRSGEGRDGADEPAEERSEGAVMSNVLVFIEQRDGKIRKSSLEALTLGRNLSAKTGGALGAVVAGEGIGSLAAELGAYGAAKVFVADRPELQLFSSEGYAAALDAAATAFKPSIVLASATVMGRDMAPRFAARRGVSVLSDVMSLDVANGRITGERPVYSGKALSLIHISEPTRLGMIS